MPKQEKNELEAARAFAQSALTGKVTIDFDKGTAMFGDMPVTRDPHNSAIWSFSVGGWDKSLMHLKDAEALQTRVRESIQDALDKLGEGPTSFIMH